MSIFSLSCPDTKRFARCKVMDPKTNTERFEADFPLPSVTKLPDALVPKYVEKEYGKNKIFVAIINE